MSSTEGPPTNDPDPINYPAPIVVTLLPKAVLFAALEIVNELFAAFAALLLTYKLIMKLLYSLCGHRKFRKQGRNMYIYWTAPSPDCTEELR